MIDAIFKRAEWNEKPPAVMRTRRGEFRVTRGVVETERDGATIWAGETATMTEAAYAAYVGAQEAEARREAAVIDDYTLALIEEGVL